MFVSSETCLEFASQFGLAICLYAKNIQNLGGNRVASAYFFLMTLLPPMNANGAGRHGWAPTNSINLYGGNGGVCVCVCVCACAHACVCVRAHACVRARCVCNIQ